MHGLRYEYQDRINFVIWDYDNTDEHAFADDLGIARHPAYGFIEPDSDTVIERQFGPLNEETLRQKLDAVIAAAARG